MLKILITAESLGSRWTGVQFYTAQLIAALTRQPDMQVTVRCTSAEAARAIEAKTAGAARCTLARGRVAAWHAGADEMRGYDIIHCPTVRAPFQRRPPGAKLVMTVHDLVPLTEPRSHRWHYRLYFRHALPRVLRMFDRMVCVSESTASDVRRFYRIGEDRLCVVPQGCRYDGEQPMLESRHREKFVLAVGTLEPRKNIRRVIEAFVNLRRQSPDLVDRLVIAGSPGWGRGETQAAIRRHADAVQWLGYVDTDELRQLYRRAAMLAYPSLYEGFGLPVLEAMAMGCPVLTSNVSSLPEVGGEAAVYVDPHSVEQIAAGMRRVLEDAELRESMARKGAERARTMTWDRCAQMMVACYEEVLWNRRRGQVNNQ